MTQVSIDYGRIERMIDRTEMRLASGIDQVGSTVGVVRQDLLLAKGELQKLRSEFDSFVQTAARTAAVQQSETRVVNLKAELDRKFGHYATVRRTSVGILQAFDVGNVGNEAVRQVSEELMIQTPRYWLAPVIVALAAWSRDSEDMAEKSVREAYARDANKTSLFFALVMRRQGRMDAAARWLKHYLTSLDPNALGREFAIILEATSYNAFGPAAQKVMSDTLTTWCSELRNNRDIVETQIRSWVGEIGGQREQLAEHTYPKLEQLSPGWPSVQRMLEQASALPVTTDKYEAISKHESTIPSVLENLLDDILDRLVTEYDGEELPLRREVLYHEAIIEESGDIALARERADRTQKALDESIDIVSLQTVAAITPELIGVSTQTQRIAIGVGQSDFHAATGRFCAAYRAGAVAVVPLNFDDRHSVFAANFGFTGCRLTTGMPESQGIKEIQSTWESTLAAHISSISFKDQWYTKPALIAGGIGLVVCLINIWAGLVALLVGAGIVYYLGEEQKKKCQAAVDAVERTRAEAIDFSVSLYRDATAEFVDALGLYHELDSQEGDLLRLIDTWPTATHTNEEES